MGEDLDHAIGKTAQFAAHCRALELLKPAPLFSDPFAAQFAGNYVRMYMYVYIHLE